METIEHQAYIPNSDFGPVEHSRELLAIMKLRRTVREFDSRPLPRELIENVLKIAGSAPSGANRQPWHFEVIEEPNLKRQLRHAAEAVEASFYSAEATKAWREDLKIFGTNSNKPYLTEAPTIIAIFSRTRIEPCLDDSSSQKTYYPTESTGIAVGFLISALHQLGLATLTHTPRPANFLNQIFELDSSYRPFLLLAVGYPKPGVRVPKITRKPLSEIARFY